MKKINIIALDIETVPDPNLSEDLRPVCKLGNLKDTAKIEAKIAEYQGGEAQNKAMSVSPYMNKIVCASIYEDKDSKWNLSIGLRDGSEKELLDFVYHSLHENQFPVVVGNNIRKFDIPTIHFRMLMNGMKESAGVIWRRYLSRDSKYSNVVDLYDYFPQPDNPRFGMSLGWLAPRILGEEKGDEGSRMIELVSEGKWQEIEDYCLTDSRQEFEIADWLGLV